MNAWEQPGLTPEERAEHAVRGLADECEPVWDDCTSCAEIITAALRAAVSTETARCLAIVRSQPNAPGTHTGERQAWVRGEIARRIGEGVTTEDVVREAVEEEREACAAVADRFVAANRKAAETLSAVTHGSLRNSLRSRAGAGRRIADDIRARAEGGGE